MCCCCCCSQIYPSHKGAPEFYFYVGKPPDLFSMVDGQMPAAGEGFKWKSSAAETGPFEKKGKTRSPRKKKNVVTVAEFLSCMHFSCTACTAPIRKKGFTDGFYGPQVVLIAILQYLGYDIYIRIYIHMCPVNTYTPRKLT